MASAGTSAIDIPPGGIEVSREEFVRRVRSGEDDRRYEYIDGRMIEVSGASIPHGVIATLIITALHTRLDSNEFLVLGGQNSVSIPESSYFLPDVTVARKPVELDEANDWSVANPVVVFEVLSRSTKQFDRTVQRDGYLSVPSLTDLVFVSQTEMAIEQYSRRSEGEWLFNKTSGPQSVISLDSIEVELSLKKIYGDVLAD
ncbi:Uma2 family endonuclease [Stratiformator vulcanicus]|uniref:Putative restriction endonuclease domain-containing protein n=1 Tax=Stratiformator vulcanicus TaxID=2527980 RepID=A0A517R281_9PLAN|nr:Uma2 family endonuclease [Stratiformator vulcanicus]QDT37964.1 hypothetical protein Pan189_23480 [Stratiformator vulcanicus]